MPDAPRGNPLPYAERLWLGPLGWTLLVVFAAMMAVAFVPLDKVVGPAVAIAAPFSRAQLLHRPATFASVPSPSEPAPAQAVISPDDVTC